MDENTELLTRQWHFPDLADEAALARLWGLAAARGWFDSGSLAATVALVRATGAAACPLPVMDGFVATGLLATAPQITAGIAAGDIRILVAVTDPATGTVPFMAAGTAASHVLALPSGGGRASLRPVEFAVPQPGLASPAWARLHLGGPEADVDVGPEQAGRALTLLRLGLAVRAMAAARQTHDRSVAHAKVRRQFGRAIGGFGAVQQRTATREIELVAGELLIEDAVRRLGADAPDGVLATELAVSHATAVASRIQLSAHHTLGAGGYFEEHDAPWLFRRVHADLALLPTCPPPNGTVADLLIGPATGLPVVGSTSRAAAVREEARSFCAAHRSRVRLLGKGDDPGLVAEMAARKWFGMTWPAADGGRDAPLIEQLAVQDETAYHQLPVAIAMAAVSVIGAPIVKYGTAGQKARYLPRILDGELTFCLGYSEPEAGSDLASLTTTAIRDGDDWVINGTKAWIGNAHAAEYIWLAVRTDVDAKLPLAGISMFMVPMATAGITTEPHQALSGQICCTVRFDDVRVSDCARVGPVNRGWQVITDTLTGERLLLAGELAGMSRRQFDELLAAVRADPDGVAGPSGSDKRARLSCLAVQVQAVNLLLTEAAGRAGSGAAHTARLASSMAGVLAAEVAEQLSRDVLEILGPAAALDAPDAPGAGIFEQGLRLSVLAFLGGGTNDVQRGLIARGLGLS
ncbi:acyl-CoA dehydrogenase [Streptomyces rishiriensis]|uniref:acyl-CoA dehydrogenase n=1 Tax=Streptomyces rishiriensis TaxID=68264 RepID=UPI0027D8AFEB|nr:acyl-CoA dehydrogenase [Streptomyces rishiriensis]